MKAALVSATSLGALLAFDLFPAHATTFFSLNSAPNFGDTLVNCAPLSGCATYVSSSPANALPETATLTPAFTSATTLSFGSTTGVFKGSALSHTYSTGYASNTTLTNTYTFAPTTVGTATQIINVIGTQTGAKGGNVQSNPVTLQGTGVAPIQSVSNSNNGYVLVGSSNSATVTVNNVGNGNSAQYWSSTTFVSVPTSVSNLNGSVTVARGTGYTGTTTPSSISLFDSTHSGGSTTASYSYTFAPTAKGQTASTTVTLSFSDGNSAGTNQTQTVNVTLSGTGVAPVATMIGGGNYALVGNSSTVSVTVQNTGNGNLSGAGTISNLQGTVLGASGLFAGSSAALTTSGSAGLTDGATQAINYTFTPTSVGTFSTSVTGTFSNGIGAGNASGSQSATLSGTGVAPAANVSVSNPNYVLVQATATATVTVSNTGNGNLAGADSTTLQTNLHGTQGGVSSSVFTGSSGTINLFDSNSPGQSTSAAYTYNFAPTQIGAASATVVTTFTNGIGSTNASGTVTSTLTGTGVAPVANVAISNAAGVGGSANTGNLGYLLVGSQSAVATVTQSNLGNGNLAGTGGIYNLNGSITNTTGNGFSGGTAGSSISLQDSHAGAQTSTFAYTFAPTVTGAATTTVYSSFSNGSTDQTNHSQTVVTTLTGTGVAPVATMTASNNNKYVLVQSSSTSTVTVQNQGNGNLAGTGGAFNLNGSVSASTGTGYTGGTGSFSLQDSNAGATTSAYTFTFAPTVVGNASAIVTGSFTNGIGNTNSGGMEAVTLTATGVAPIQSVSSTATVARINKYGGTNANTGTAAVTVQNVGNGNLAGTGGNYNLNGTVGNTLGSGFTGGTVGSPTISLLDSNASGGPTTSTYTYTFAPTTRGTVTSTVNVAFSNGNSAGTNLSQTVATSVTGTGVGPTYQSAIGTTSNVVTPKINGGTSHAASISFGTVGRNTTNVIDLYLSNTTTDPDAGNPELTTLTINTATLSGGNDVSAFQIGSVNGTEIAADPTGANAIEVQLTLTANNYGNLTTYLAINTDENAPYQASGDTFYYALSAYVPGTGAPEPASLAVLGVGLAGLGWARRRCSGGGGNGGGTPG